MMERFLHPPQNKIFLKEKSLKRSLKEIGLTPGPVFKKALEDLLSARLDGKVSNYEQEIAYIKKKYVGEALGAA